MKLFGGFHGNRTRQGLKKTQRPAPPPEEPDQQEKENRTVFRTPDQEAEIEEIIAAYQKKKRRRRWILLAVVILLAVGGWVLWKTTVRPPEIVQPTLKPTPTQQPTESTPGPNAGAEVTSPPEETAPPVERMRRENVYTFLLVGREPSYGNTDVIMVGVYDAGAGTVDIVSIPRDTCANVESDPGPGKNETKKINSVDARAGIEGLRAAVADIVGFPIDCCISVRVRGFISLVDTIGGVNFYIPYYMNYDDPTQNLHIHYSEGEHYLTGADAINVVRWRQNNDGTNYGDIARIQTQQNFLKTILKKCLSLSNLVSNLDNYIQIFQDSVETDLNTGNLTWFAKEFLKLDMENLRFHTLPCKYNDMIRGFAYCTILPEEWLAMLNEYMNVYDQPIELEDVDIIYRDENGDLAATSGEIRGGMESFLSMSDYVVRLEEWNRYLAEQREKEEAAAAAAAAAAGGGEETTPDSGGDNDTNGGE